MFFQPPDDEPICSKTLQNNPRHRRLKKLRRKHKLKAIKKNQFKQNNSFPIPITMSSWAESFTNAATWQLKHQVAFWKSRATALEYENKILHDIIRKNYTNTSQSANGSRTNSEHEELEEVCDEAEIEYEDNDDGDLEVSEEFIQFLRDNQKYRDDAKRERERRDRKIEEQKAMEEMAAGPTKNVEDTQEVLESRYGSSWERIVALESSLRSDFINISDREKPTYWPNIPLNFG